jgi:hypothetical protein
MAQKLAFRPGAYGTLSRNPELGALRNGTISTSNGRFSEVTRPSTYRQTRLMQPPDQIVVTLSLPKDLVSFARACVASEDIAECVTLALQLLRRDIEELARSLDKTQ